jgi:hypothetical protein
MTSPVTRGARDLRRLLREQTCDVRTLDLAGFRRWLAGHRAHWQRDAVFVQRARIRDLRRAHPRLRALEEEPRQAVDGVLLARVQNLVRPCRADRGTGSREA